MLRAALIAVALLLVLALADLPYGYYQFLRIAATGVLIWLAIVVWDRAVVVERLMLIGLAVSYNPIFKIHMEKETHAVVNLLTVALVAIEYVRHRTNIDAT